MKNLNLENLGVQEMDAKEMVGVDGGVYPILAAIGFAIALYDIGSDLYEGWNEGHAKAKKH